jgi:hypothetical protein
VGHMSDHGADLNSTNSDGLFSMEVLDVCERELNE